ncbi:prosaposin-like [Stegostoma tigrinum]|uniref:prosaposin-like n=1 Tax=Stegostoma tigrinum TaxID=3053191 RepID=UPI00286FBAC5|nr:prosaposin-like [Stegostoma tigrinum]
MGRVGELTTRLLLDEEPMGGICSHWAICPRRLETRDVAQPTMTCELCEEISLNLQSFWREGVEMGTLQQEVCRLYAHESSLLCMDFIQSHKEEITEAVEDPSFHNLCLQLRVCTEKQQLINIGRDKCTWGPWYWCSSKEHASLCRVSSDLYRCYSLGREEKMSRPQAANQAKL